MRILVLALSLLAITAANADQDAEIARKAAECWDLPVGTAGLSRAQFDVTLDADGFVTDATVLDHKADRTSTKVFVLSALRALQKCAPYRGVSGTRNVTMDVSDIPPRGGINPFK